MVLCLAYLTKFQLFTKSISATKAFDMVNYQYIKRKLWGFKETCLVTDVIFYSIHFIKIAAFSI